MTNTRRGRGTTTVAGPALSLSGASLPELVAVQVEARPDEVAVVCDRQSLTFGELDERAGRVADRLLASGVNRGDVVALCVERSLDMVVSLLAIVRAGAAYLPLDPRYPAERLRFLLEDSGARMLVAQRHLLGALADPLPPVIGIGDPADPVLPRCSAQDTGPDDLAYILYTSGSTGQPKGVEVRHGGVVNLLTSMAGEPGVGPQDRVLAITTYGFDMSVPELWLPLVTGARMVVATQDVVSDGRRLGRLISEADISFMQGTPTTWQMLIDTGWRGKPDMAALTGGETLPAALAEQLLERCAVLWNAYGPTETTVWSTLGRVERGAPVTVGRPIANTTIAVVDAERRQVDVGATGEILIGGDGVARGYHNRPDLTTERFIQTSDGNRVYATGDLGRLRPDGRLEHRGRIDEQIKLRGFRIELGEIEAALTTHPDVTAAAVVVREMSPSDIRLVAYIVPRGSTPPPAAELRGLLRRRLPEQMVPARYVTIDALPVTPNGKLDRRALPAPPPETEPRAAHAGSRTPVEERLVRLWAGLLDLDSVGIDEDFFDLGGHSLLAVRMLGDVERQLAVEVTVAAFYNRGRTVAGLAGLITGHRDGDADGLVVSIQAEGSRPPLFFVYPSESSMLTVRHFTGPLGGDQPVIGLLPQRTRGRFDPSRGVEELSAGIVERLRSVQPLGPYYLAGYSFGGLLAYEVARILQDAGEEVAWLGVLDAATPQAAIRYHGWRERLGRTLRRGPSGAARKASLVMRRESRALLVRLGLRQPHVDDDYDWRGAARLTNRYQCRGHAAPMVVFLTRDQMAGTASPTLGWEGLHGGSLAAREVPGDHLSMVQEPNAEVLAGVFADSLRDAQGGRAAAAR